MKFLTPQALFHLLSTDKLRSTGNEQKGRVRSTSRAIGVGRRRLWQKSTSSDWIISLKSKIGALDDERSLKMSIFKVPNKLRKVDEEAYSPRLVSIGPFHSSRTNKHDHLLAMDEQKRWYMLYLLNRTLNPEETLVQFVEAISELKPKVQRRYAENIKFKPQVLSEIMLDDGCFILELFLRSKLKDFGEEDPIFHNAWMVPTLRHDLALLENQIPFFILEKLFNIVVRQFPEHLSCSITDLALSFFYPDLNLNQEAIRMKCSQVGICSHLLDLLHSFYIPTFPETDPKAKETRKFNKCATELVAAGIEFVKGKEDHFLDINFNKATGVITIPSFHIDERTKSLIRNFIALEQSIGSGTQQHITSYAILLESLIRSSSDIALLWKENIITNDLSEFEDVLTFFKSISREVVPMDFNFGALCEDVCSNKCWNNVEKERKKRKAFYLKMKNFINLQIQYQSASIYDE
ncbi:hypothetical protein L1049_025357 [Liquidambar formosana]|uniref:Uncharacterized protein n=1 Tax=Liquidambar formosana TaxID=63359 RepID=A0AAP0N8N7_LIQFO